MDITKPFQGTWAIPTSRSFLQLPISYKGLHEVCAICSSATHALEACPNTPKNVLEVIVEKFGATSIQIERHVSNVQIGARPTTLMEN